MTDRYAVFGNPVAHSKSPLIHSLFAKQTKQDIAYDKQLVPLDGFVEAADKFFSEGGKGLNITVPFKLDAFEFAEKNGSVSDRAKLAGAVNTLKLMPDGKIFGDNTDGCGLVRDIMQNLGWQIKGKHILILGAGGAVRGVLGPLFAENPAGIVIANRTLSKAKELRDLFKKTGNISVWDIDALDMPNQNFDLIINSTSITLGGDAADLSTLILAVNVSENICAYDMVYGKPSPFASMCIDDPQPGVPVPLNFRLRLDTTPFQAHAELRGIPSADGLGMLVEQAAESFYIWRDVRPETATVINEVRGQL